MLLLLFFFFFFSFFVSLIFPKMKYVPNLQWTRLNLFLFPVLWATILDEMLYGGQYLVTFEYDKKYGFNCKVDIDY
jgi:hypothetical protein